MTSAAKSTSLRVVAGFSVALAAVQLIRPELPHPLVTADLQAPAAVKEILKTACYPCHSNEVRLSWFDEIVPAYQLVAYDIKKGRSHLNFSEIGALPAAQRNALLFEAVNHIQMGAMPLPRYVCLHPEAVITPAQLAILRNYLLSLEPNVAAGMPNLEAGHTSPGNDSERLRVRDAPNGIAFLPDYKHWRAISSTVRSDSQTLRQILANKVAIKAIVEHHISPWPDGSVLAKVVWHQETSEYGTIEAGKFVHVAFMIKDKSKYASTAGWGWAQWNGAELTPFGNGRDFANGCVACHAPLHASDYVFTMPIQSGRARR